MVLPGRIDTDRIKEVYPDGPTDADLATIPLRRLGERARLLALQRRLTLGQVEFGLVVLDGADEAHGDPAHGGAHHEQGVVGEFR